MSNRDIKKFLPPVYKTDEIKNFLDSTTNKLFEEKNSERVNYYIGMKSGGIYEHLSDPYAEERTKLREDYQLEPALVERDPQSGDVVSLLYYEDLLNSLESSGSYTDDQNRLFQEEVYSFAPPIDYDMFINYRDYYWIPEGAPAVEIDAIKSDIEGNITYSGKVTGTNEYLTFTTGNHVILSDGKEYIVDGVGNSIRLQEFDLSNELPLRVERAFFSENLDMYEKFPKEYITMERGASDYNPWSRNNSWYHRDALFPPVSTVPKFKVERNRRALRPIIQFIRDIELHNYHRGGYHVCDVYGNTNSLSTSSIDDVAVFSGMLAIKSNSRKIYQYTGSEWVEYSDPTGKVIVRDGRTKKSTEWVWKSGSWSLQQQKTANTQPIRFQLYDSSDNDTAMPVGEGNTLFTYKLVDTGIYDNELELTIDYRMSGDSSDFTFENSIREDAINTNINDLSYKLYTNEIPVSDRVLNFTMGLDSSGNETIFINDRELPTIIINSGIPYEFQYGDSSTTAWGWFGKYFPITIVDGDGNQLIRPTHGHSNRTRVSLQYDLPVGVEEDELFYRLESDYSVQGRIVVLPEVAQPEFNLYNEFRFKGSLYTTLRQVHEVEDDGDISLELKYQPISDDYTVMVNGEDLNEYEFINRTITIRDLSRGDLVEVFYTSRDRLSTDDDVVQEVFQSLTNNAGNEDPIDFSFSEVFNHFGSIIRNQRYLEGTPLGTNTYRDSGKDISLGSNILKHTAPMLPLMFINKSEEINLIEAIEHSNVFYTQYKNNLVLKAEEYQRNSVITPRNTKDIFDDIVTDINASRQTTDSFASSYMFASYKNYISLGVSANGTIQQTINLENDTNTMYVYTAEGIKIVDEDYTITYNTSNNTYKINPITFDVSDIEVIRYYDDIQSTFCPATPAKFGIFKPSMPRFEIDDTFINPVLMLIGHDSSKTVAYTSISNFNNGIIDGRDLILLELENRIFNGIDSKFKEVDTGVIDVVKYVPGKFRKNEYTREEYNSLEYERFFKWSTLNMTDYTTNVSYIEGNPFTYNYSYNTDIDGQPLPGHWKGIFEYYYDTYTPHTTPWKMLGFDIKPEWFDDEYGTDYSSNNNDLWNDLSEGIIRQGKRRNIDGREYLNDNPYRRVGLMSVIPVNSDGELLNPIDIGITTLPEQQNAKRPWRFGDNAPVEQAWKMMSEYQFNRVAVMYTQKPAETVARLWDTLTTITNGDLQNIPVTNYRVHNEQHGQLVFGITQWIHDLVLGDNLTPSNELVTPFRNIDLNLAHKVGGFVNASELRLFSESYNPDSETLSTLVPYEDVNIVTYQSKDIHSEVYSGVVIERVEASKAYYAFIPGYVYTQDDIIYSFEDDAYYKKSSTVVYDLWESTTNYIIGDEVKYDNKVYVCTSNNVNSSPSMGINWELKPFINGEWAILISTPKSSKSEYRVYGYNVRSPYFPVSIPLAGGKRKSMDIETSKSSTVKANPWTSNMNYTRGHIVTYDEQYYEADVSHRSGNSFDSELWIRWNTAPTINTVRVDYSTESSGNIELIEYGTRYKSIDEVVEFLASYGRELENRGWVFKDYDQEVKTTKDWNFIIKEFVRWSIDHRDIGSAITLSPFSRVANFKPKHGVVSLINQFKRSAFNLLDHRSAIIPSDLVDVTRVNNVFRLESPEPIYFLRLGIREYEHSISVNNETIFGDVNYEPIIGVRKERLRMSGTKSLGWDGTLHAAGYIVTNDDMIPNLNTVSEELLNVNDMDTVATKDIINELKYHNLGYQKRSYLENLEMTDKSQINFYQGFIRQKGTTEAFQRLLRSNIIDANNALDISEEWAFREGVFGSNYNKLQVEFKLLGEDFNFNPQYINLVYNDYDTVESFDVTNINYNDQDKWVMKPERIHSDGNLWEECRPNHKFKTAGYVQFEEHNLKSPSMKKLNSIMENSNYALNVGLTSWIALNEATHGSWDVLLLSDSEVFIGEIYNHGNNGENSAVVKAYNVNEDVCYIVAHPSGYYNVKFRYIKDGYYILLSHDDNEYVTFSPSIEYMDLTIMEWKSLRIIENHHERTIPTVDEYVTEHEIRVVDNLLIYRDAKHYGHDDWEVYQYINGAWNIIRMPRNVVNIELFNDVVAYDIHDEVLDYVRPYDPIMGYTPGTMIHEVDIISDVDPVTYTENEYSHSRYSQMEGVLWLDSKDLIYIDYHQGDIDYRKAHWGSLFPGIDVSIYEWTKSSVIPSDYDGDTLYDNKFITQQVFDSNIGMYKTWYYFWVKNPISVPSNHERMISANEISQSIKYPSNNGIPLLQVLDNHTLGIIDNSRRLIMNDVVLRVNYQFQYTTVPTHTQWLLLSESGDNDDVPTFIFQKMIDSIVGYDDSLNPIPDLDLPETTRYGVNRGQTWFKDLNGAREVFFDIINEFLRKINIWDIELFWERLYGGIDTTSGYIDYVEWNHEDYNPNTVITSIVNSRIETTMIPLFDGEYVKVIERPSNKPSMRNGGWTIYQYNESDDSYKKMAQSNATFEFNVDKILNEGIPLDEANNIRFILNIIFENFAIRPYHEIINNVLFSMVRLIMAKQPNNNWLFPSTYISVRQEMTNLVPSFMYRRDREQEIKDYIREAKPYHTKLRDFNKINSPRDEYIGMKVTDFDKPPHIDQDKNFFILQEKIIDKVIPVDGQLEYQLIESHTDNIQVTFGEDFVSPDRYRIVGRTITFNEQPPFNEFYVPSIIVESDNMIHRDIIENWNPTYGYRLLEDTRNLDAWSDLAINKDIEIHYDRTGFSNSIPLEKIVEIHEYAYNETREPLAYIDGKSENGVEVGEALREIDRVLIHQYYDDVYNLVNNSKSMVANGNETYFFEFDGTMSDVIVLVNNILINSNTYDLIHESNKTIIRFKFELLENDFVVVRPRIEWLTLIRRATKQLGLNIPEDVPTLLPEGESVEIVEIDSRKPNALEHEMGDMDILIFDHGTNDDPVISGGDFHNSSNGYPEELSALKISESMVFMSLNQIPPLVKMGFNGFAEKDIQETHAFDIVDGVREYPMTVTVPAEQIKIIVGDDVLIPSVDYAVFEDKIETFRDLPTDKQLVVTDLYSNFDPNYHNDVKRIKNIAGGFDSYVFDYSRIDEAPLTREFIVYDKAGHSYYFKTNEENYLTVVNNPTHTSSEIVLDSDVTVHNKIFAIIGFNETSGFEKIDYSYEIVRGSIIDGILTNMTRGLFVGENDDFSGLVSVRVYELQLEDSLDNYVIQEAIVGKTGRHSYPKYGNLFK